MRFADSSAFFSESYKRSLETKLTYLEDNIVSALDLVQIVRDKYRKRQLEEYAVNQAEILSYTVEALM